MHICDTAADWITEAEIEAFLGESIDAALATFLIETTQSLIREYTGQCITEVEDDIEFVDGTGRDAFRLRQRPVTEIAELLEDGTDTPAGTYPDHDWMFDQDTGVVFREAGKWRPGRGNIKVTYTHGWAAADVPAVLVAVSLNVARRLFNTYGTIAVTGTVQSETIGAYSYTLAVTADQMAGVVVGLVPSEKAVLSRFRVAGPEAGSKS